MAGGQERILRQRIRSINATKKITRAFELIAASRIVRAQQRARRAGRRLVVVRGRGTPIAQVLAATAMDRVLELADDPAAADEPATRA